MVGSNHPEIRLAEQVAERFTSQSRRQIAIETEGEVEVFEHRSKALNRDLLFSKIAFSDELVDSFRMITHE
jgi:hypothetical protein